MPQGRGNTWLKAWNREIRERARNLRGRAAWAFGPQPSCARLATHGAVPPSFKSRRIRTVSGGGRMPLRHSRARRAIRVFRGYMYFRWSVAKSQILLIQSFNPVNPVQL